MLLRTRRWIWLGLLFLAAGALFWQLSHKRNARRDDSADTSAGTQPFALRVTNYVAATNPGLKSMFAVVATNPPNAVNTNKLAYRLSNTKQPLKELARNDRAVLLRNAFIDTTLPGRPLIPEHLKAKGDPGSSSCRREDRSRRGIAML